MYSRFLNLAVNSFLLIGGSCWIIYNVWMLPLVASATLGWWYVKKQSSLTYIIGLTASTYIVALVGMRVVGMPIITIYIGVIAGLLAYLVPVAYIIICRKLHIPLRVRWVTR